MGGDTLLLRIIERCCLWGGDTLLLRIIGRCCMWDGNTLLLRIIERCCLWFGDTLLLRIIGRCHLCGRRYSTERHPTSPSFLMHYQMLWTRIAGDVRKS